MEAGAARLVNPPPRPETNPEAGHRPAPLNGQHLSGCGATTTPDRDEQPAPDTESSGRAAGGTTALGCWGLEEPGGQLPIMNWEALESHIAGLQLRETERRAREGPRLRPVETPPSPTGRRRWDGTQRLVSWHRADSTAWKALGATIGCESRFHSRMNLRLCFTNDSDSDNDTGDASEPSPEDPAPELVAGETSEAERALLARKRELEREAKRSLALVKRQLDLERQRQQEHASLGRGPLTPSDLWEMSLLQLQDLRASVFTKIHRLNTQLMELLEVRDDLKTEQDAMLVEIGDLTH
ncbi:schwannomin-interacting protein 1-like [Hemitrygon akajei]|uniref:schwannomin-interacting protein 1-like n=1 Tax=Hemitrygon akajei TaxID=2704970 RepID=UPI003BF96DA6